MILIAPSQEVRLRNQYLNSEVYLIGVSNVTLLTHPLKLTVWTSLIILDSDIIIPPIVEIGLGAVSTISNKTLSVYLTMVLVDTYCSFLRQRLMNQFLYSIVSLTGVSNITQCSNQLVMLIQIFKSMLGIIKYWLAIYCIA